MTDCGGRIGAEKVLDRIYRINRIKNRQKIIGWAEITDFSLRPKGHPLEMTDCGGVMAARVKKYPLPPLGDWPLEKGESFMRWGAVF